MAPISTFHRSIMHGLLRIHKHTLSPILTLFGARCRHVPTCSQYSAEAIARFGFWPGGWMMLARLSRCRPGGSCGHDPVPEQIEHIPFWMPWRYGDWALHERLFPDEEAGGDQIRQNIDKTGAP